MRISGAVYASFFAFALVRCGGDLGSSGASGGGAANVDAFVGTWACDSKAVIMVTTPAGMPDRNQQTNFTFTVTKKSSSTIIAGDANDPSCSDELTVSGSKASIEKPFECSQDGTMSKVTQESISVSGDKLTGTRTASLSATASNGDPIAGTGTTTIECTRISGPSDGGPGGSGGQNGTGGRTDGGNATGSGGATSADDCATDAACVDCCSKLQPAGSDVLTNLLLDCSCQQCGTECAASLCSENSTTPADGDPCETCVRQALSDSGPCTQRAANACQKNNDCSALAACLATCPSGSPI